ncbi:hypothetical protein BRD00_10140 [Halobacteriales archaeon QS_8_69_26]|nr:MAG: hypothetical protein BRD00_10140 [Halobacteriales archaeon QS_8_69_26]
MADVQNVPEHGRIADRVRGPIALSGAVLIAIGLPVGYGREFRPATSARPAAIPPILLLVTTVSLGTGSDELLRAFDSDPVGNAIGGVIVLAILVPIASEASRSRARDASTLLLVAGFLGAFLVGVVPVVLGGPGLEFAPVGGLAATLAYALAPDDG